MTTNQKKNGGSKPQAVNFHYIKNQGFRVIHVDGAIGSTTPNGMIHCSLYSERQAIPRRVTQSLKSDGTLGNEFEIESRDGFVREIDVDAMMTLATAKNLAKWLTDRINELEATNAKKRGSKI